MIWGRGHAPLERWWFAWHPVQLTQSGRWVWWGMVYRRRIPQMYDERVEYSMSE